MIGSSTYNLSYDAENHLTGVSGAVSATFVYGGDGNRVKGTVGGSTTAYIGSHFEFISSTSTMIKYYYEGGTRVAMRVGSSTRYYLLTDHLGSTTITANSSGGLYSEKRYMPWGEERWASGTIPTTYLYTGQREEEGLGLYFYNARWYDPYLNRWIQPDSIIPDQYNSTDWDRYAFVRNNPLSLIDPSGHEPCLPKQCGYMVDGDDGWVNPNAYEHKDSASPYDVGLEWLSGEGSRRHVFVDGDPFTELLKQHEHIQNVRGLIAQRLNEGDYKSHQEDYYLGGLEGVPKYVRDYSTLVTLGNTGNLAVTYLGSYELHYYVNDVDVKSGEAKITFYVYNESTIASATHPPVLGYTEFWENHITPFVNSIVSRGGPMSTVTQTFLWTETIAFP